MIWRHTVFDQAGCPGFAGFHPRYGDSSTIRLTKSRRQYVRNGGTVVDPRQLYTDANLAGVLGTE